MTDTARDRPASSASSTCSPSCGPGKARTALLLALERLPDPDGVLHPEDRARGADPRRGDRGAQELPVGGSGGAAGVRRCRSTGASVAAFPRMKLINVVTVFFIVCPLRVLRAGAGRRAARDDLLRLDRHLQPDDRRAVLVVRQRRLLEGGRRAPARHRRLRRVARRGGRRARGRSADRAVRRAPADAARRRACSAAQLLLTNYIDRVERGRRPRAAPAKTAQGSRAARERRSRWCSGRATCC